jgi:hypothetical protein
MKLFYQTVGEATHGERQLLAEIDIATFSIIANVLRDSFLNAFLLVNSLKLTDMRPEASTDLMKYVFHAVVLYCLVNLEHASNKRLMKMYNNYSHGSHQSGS